jgi:hypothetical protein
MRRLAPFLTLALIIAGFWWALEGAPAERRREVGHRGREGPASSPSDRPASRPESAATRSQPESAESRPESQPESAPAPVEEVVVIEVLREDHSPIGGAMVSLNRDDVPAGATASDGRAQFPAAPGVTADVTVTGREFFPVDAKVALDSGTRQIVVPTRSRVAGKVFVDGKVPDEPIALTLFTEGDAPLANAAISWASERHTTTVDDGAFEFFNLPADWRGRIAVSSDYRIAIDDSVERPLSAPNPALELRIIEMPVVKGRILRHGSREPTEGLVTLHVESDQISEGTHTFAGEDGRFRYVVDAEVLKVVLEVSDANGLGTKKIELAGPFDTVRNLGDLELAKVGHLAFRVRDPESRPVAGAVGAVSGSAEHSEPTGEDGTSGISIDDNPRELRVAKLGYATTVVRVPESRPTSVDVELKPGNVLVVAAKLPDGTVPKYGTMAVMLSSTSPMFTGPDGMSDDLYPRTGASENYEESLSSPGTSSVRFHANQSGHVVVGGFKPGAAVTIELRGTVLDETLAEDFVIMPETGTKTITLRPARAPQQFTGVVRTPEGRPVEGASGYVRGAPDRDGSRFETDAEGRFVVDGIFASTVFVHVTALGFVPLEQDKVAVGGLQSFTLIPTRKVTVELVDDHGAPVLDWAWMGWTRLGSPDLVHESATSLGRGLYEVADLPPDEVDLHVEIGVTVIRRTLDPRKPVTRIVVPHEGTAELHWRRDARDPQQCRIRIDTPVGQVAIDVPAEIGDHWLQAIVPPGIYTATVERWDAETEEWVTIATSRSFEIAAHHATDVELRR